DESDGTFLDLHTELALVTSVEADHLEHYGSLAALQEAFGRFLAGATGGAVVCADDEAAFRLGGAVGAASYGTSDAADYRMVEPSTSGATSAFTIEHAGQDLGRISVAAPGLYNARHACGAVVAALRIGAPF